MPQFYDENWGVFIQEQLGNIEEQRSYEKIQPGVRIDMDDVDQNAKSYCGYVESRTRFPDTATLCGQHQREIGGLAPIQGRCLRR